MNAGQPLTAVFPVRADHPALAGHYPGFSLLPGLLLVEYTTAAVRRAGIGRLTEIVRLRFRGPVRPGDTVRVEAVLTAERGHLCCAATVSTATGPVADLRIHYAPAGQR